MNTAITTDAATAITPGAGTRSRRHRTVDDVVAGVRAMLPWLVGVVPFGMVVGMNARTSDVELGVGLLTGATIYSGSAQLSAVGLLSEGAGVVVVVASVLIINARLILYGSSIGPHWRGMGLGYRAWAAYLLVDPSYVVGMRRYEDGSTRAGSAHVHYLAAGVTLWVAWHAAMLTGAVVGTGLPGWLPLQYAVPLFLLAEVVQVVRTRPGLTAAVVAGTVAAFGTNLPLHSGLLLAVVAGVTGASAVDRRSR
ncbi:MAG TPA: AzlC family ABC transporter permease [Ilumatobacter sp.]|nr:AzlC family ABC transporter permease [Ilumatobacter sp.]